MIPDLWSSRGESTCFENYAYIMDTTEGTTDYKMQKFSNTTRMHGKAQHDGHPLK